MTSTTTSTLPLWRSSHAEPAVARIAIAGDFLPAWRCDRPIHLSWRAAAEKLAPSFDDISAFFANLECCLNAGGLPSRTLAGLGDIVSAPAASLDFLEAFRTVAVGIANNHSYDFGVAGIERTRAAIAGSSIVPLGAGRTLRNPPEVFVWHGPHSVRVGFWAAATATRDPAKPSKPGVEPATFDRAREALDAMNHLGASTRIALLHAGCLRTSRPDPEQLRLMDSLAALGFDVVAASHSHRIAGHRQFARKNGGASFSFYGLGSIVSGYASSPLEREGLVVVAGLDRHGRMASLEVRPVLLDAAGLGATPSRASGCEILNRFTAFSAEIADGSWEQRFYREISQGLLRVYARDISAAFRAGGIRALARKTSRVRLSHLRRLAHR